MLVSLFSLRPVAVTTLCLFLCFSFTSPSHSAFNSAHSAAELRERNRAIKDDLDGMISRKFIRILIPYSKTFFFFDGAAPKGLSYENAIAFEKFLNKKLKKKQLIVKALVIPTSRENLITKIKNGYGDIAIGNLTITDERLKHVDFSNPFMQGIDEIVVSSINSEKLKQVFDLSGKKIHVRRSSSYYEHLTNLNEVLTSAGKSPVKIVLSDEHLEDEDLLEMVNADLIPLVIVDSHKAQFWAQILSKIRLHPKVKIHSDGRIAWAIRKNSPQLMQLVNEYTAKNKKGTLAGNIAFNKYLKNSRYITNAMEGKELLKFNNTVELFKKYGHQYDFDHLMLAALGFQESRLDQNARSHVGAIGIMQILPSTASDKNVNVKGIDKAEPNIHAGTKYLHFMANRYFDHGTGIDPFNRAMFSFASYNAGPARVAQLRKEAEQMGLNPDIWFNNVEVVASKRIGRETVQYVSNILKYYVAYKLLDTKLEDPKK